MSLHGNTKILIESFDEKLSFAADWSSRQIALGTIIVLGGLYLAFEKKYDVNWYSMVHAAFVGYGSLACVLINYFLSQNPEEGLAEPLRSVLCQGPLTRLHSIIPAISMGFGLFDIAEGIHNGGWDFILHGLATFSVMAYFCEYDFPQIITPMLLMEISTPFLCLLRATFFNEKALAANMALFGISFFLFRIIIVPYLWFGIFWAAYRNLYNPQSHECLPWHFVYVVFTFGMFFHCLNLYWATRIIRKVRRKVSGIEKISEGNGLSKRERQREFEEEKKTD